MSDPADGVEDGDAGTEPAVSPHQPDE